MKREAVVLLVFFFEIVGIQKVRGSALPNAGLAGVVGRSMTLQQRQKPQAQGRERSKSLVVPKKSDLKNDQLNDQLLVAASLPDVTKKDSVDGLKIATAVVTAVAKLQLRRPVRKGL